jgi:hypothetical protein
VASTIKQQLEQCCVSNGFGTEDPNFFSNSETMLFASLKREIILLATLALKGSTPCGV